LKLSYLLKPSDRLYKRFNINKWRQVIISLFRKFYNNES